MAHCCKVVRIMTQYLNVNALVWVVAWAGKGAGLMGTGRPLGFYELGVRLRLRHRQAILPQTFKMQGDCGTNILV